MMFLARPVVLVGLMGAGKTRVGGELGSILGLPFTDTDREIAAAAGLSVAEIFEKFGEAKFRAAERRVIEELLLSGPCVIASGGGAFIQDDIRENIRARGISVWLKADLDVLTERTTRTDVRPLLREGDPRDILRELMAERDPVYALADITVDVSAQTPREMAHLVRDALEAYLRKPHP